MRRPPTMYDNEAFLTAVKVFPKKLVALTLLSERRAVVAAKVFNNKNLSLKVYS